jgi:hypothetical protein
VTIGGFKTSDQVQGLKVLKLYLTAKAQRAQRENFFIKNLCGLCVSAVNHIKMTGFHFLL